MAERQFSVTALPLHERPPHPRLPPCRLRRPRPEFRPHLGPANTRRGAAEAWGGAAGNQAAACVPRPARSPSQLPRACGKLSCALCGLRLFQLDDRFSSPRCDMLGMPRSVRRRFFDSPSGSCGGLPARTSSSRRRSSLLPQHAAVARVTAWELGALSAAPAALGGALSSASGFEVRGRGKQTLVNFLVPKSTFWGLPRLVVRGRSPEGGVCFVLL
ncbi:uncharacterized protein LOC118615054 [Rousettus aegyptiacus]|uniref:uncharacterized protein LOC118615054 n=1 Tax=Rousettus aegyptiacus TaxID=9407 RepID=UPI00168D438C|nr:uncharacterized protein LOC118615054 [Rousettus aegyptiacus]